MRLQVLDLLRFLAAMAVVLYHYTAQPNGSFPELAQVTQFGYLGVPLFFMISGFVIAASAERRSPLAFMVSRATRLYPAFWMGVLFTSIMIFALDDASPSPIQLIANLTMLNDYLGIANIDGVYWTLQVELKFYACVFLLMALGLFKRYSLWLPIWLAMTLSYLILGQPSKMGWLINPGYSCYFISGVCLYLLWCKHHTTTTNITLAVASLVCLYQAYQQASGFMNQSDQADWYIATVLVAVFHLTFLLIALDKLKLKPLTIYGVLGGLTYPLYLLHNHAGKLLIAKLEPLITEPVAILITTSIMLGLSYYIYSTLEPRAANRLKQLLEKLFRLNTKGALNTESKAP